MLYWQLIIPNQGSIFNIYINNQDISNVDNIVLIALSLVSYFSSNI